MNGLNKQMVSSNKNLTITNKNVINRPFSADNIPTYLTKEEIDSLLSAIPESSKRDYMLVYFLWTTGSRITEALNIRKKDIDFYYRTVKIQWLKKRKKQERVIPLHQNTAYQLSIYCSSLNQDDKLFPISRIRAFQIIRDCARKAGINKTVGCHTLRHSFSVYFLKQRKNIVALQKLLGHSQITTTMVYLNIVQSDLQQEIDMINF